MPRFEIFGKEERKEVNEVLETAILMYYRFNQTELDDSTSPIPQPKPKINYHQVFKKCRISETFPNLLD
jgi:hypothetical protein